MTGSEILQMQFDRLAQEFTNTLGNLGAATLAWRPAPRANDIASVVWHSARAWDGYLFYLDGGIEVFVTQDWATRFGMKTAPKNGFDGTYTEAQVACVRARPKLLIEYVTAILERTKKFLAAASPDELAELLKIPWWPEEKPKAFVLAHVIRHSYEHLGEAQYVKGLMKAKSSKRKAKAKQKK
ncbi:MAG: DinB family protein [Chloroflexi bacterium]|nr:DinB family protein [Chloroflexota bacterium]